MNRRELLGIFVSVLFLGLGTLGAQSRPVAAVADIPFAFHVGDEDLPAGSYSFAISRETLNQLMVVSGREKEVFRLFSLGKSGNGDNRCEVVFRKYQDGSYFLAEVRLPGQPYQRIPRSKSEEAIITTDWSVKQIALSLRPVGPDSGE